VGYEWDPAKARANAAKHCVHFGDAVAALEKRITIRLDGDTLAGFAAK
jgi:uncharacterized DUF497 family protein